MTPVYLQLLSRDPEGSGSSVIVPSNNPAGTNLHTLPSFPELKMIIMTFDQYKKPDKHCPASASNLLSPAYS